jgi:hypothetical protein
MARTAGAHRNGDARPATTSKTELVLPIKNNDYSQRKEAHERRG